MSNNNFFEDLLKDDVPISLEKDIDPLRLLELDAKLMKLFIQPNGELEHGIHTVQFRENKDVEKRLDAFKEAIKDYNRNEIVAFIFYQKIQFLQKVSILTDILEKGNEGGEDEWPEPQE